MLLEGHEANISDGLAKELVAAGLVEEVGDSDGENKDEAIAKANEGKAKEANSTVSVMEAAEPAQEPVKVVKAPKIRK